MWELGVGSGRGGPSEWIFLLKAGRGRKGKDVPVAGRPGSLGETPLAAVTGAPARAEPDASAWGPATVCSRGPKGLAVEEAMGWRKAEPEGGLATQTTRKQTEAGA